MRLTEDRFAQAPLNESRLERIGETYTHLTNSGVGLRARINHGIL